MSQFRNLSRFILSFVLCQTLPVLASGEISILPDNYTDEVFIRNQNTWQEYGKSFDQFAGVLAYSNRAHGAGGEFQCTELVHRYLKTNLGVPTRIGMGLGHAKDILQNLERHFEKQSFRVSHGNTPAKVKMRFVKNGSSISPPRVGAPISFTIDRYGHVAIVRHVKKISDSELELFLFEQHGGLPFKVGEHKPIRSVRSTQNSSGFWLVPDAIGWLSFVEAETSTQHED